jgi:hypothetical protein
MGKQDGGLQLLKGAAAAGCHQCHYRILSGGSSGLHMLHLGWGERCGRVPAGAPQRQARSQRGGRAKPTHPPLIG